MNNPSRSDRSPNTPEGRAALGLFQLSPDLIHLNHGSYGAVPKAVREEYEAFRRTVESVLGEGPFEDARAEGRRLSTAATLATILP